MTTWVSIGSKIYPKGQEFIRKLPSSTDQCFGVVSIIPNMIYVFVNLYTNFYQIIYTSLFNFI